MFFGLKDTFIYMVADNHDFNVIKTWVEVGGYTTTTMLSIIYPFNALAITFDL